MKLHFKLTIFLCCIALVTFGAEIGVYDIPLSWKNFVGRKDFDRHPYFAKIYTYFTYSYKFKEQNGKWIFLFETSTWVDEEKSWVKKKFFRYSTGQRFQSITFALKRTLH